MGARVRIMDRLRVRAWCRVKVKSKESGIRGKG